MVLRIEIQCNVHTRSEFIFLPPRATLSFSDFPVTPRPGLGSDTVSMLLKEFLIPIPASLTVSEVVSLSYNNLYVLLSI